MVELEVAMTLKTSECAMLWAELRRSADKYEEHNQPVRAEALRVLANRVMEAYKNSHKE